MKRKNIIWDLNKSCAYDCKICCVDAYHVSSKDGQIEVRINHLAELLNFDRDNSINLFDDANRHLQKKGLELSLEDKLKILENIDIPGTIDFSGGDPLLLKENLAVLSKASDLFGKENISATTTGIGLSSIDPNFLNQILWHIDFTYDFPGKNETPYRPKNYNFNNLKTIKKLNQSGIKTTAQIPLNLNNVNPQIIEEIFYNLNEACVEKIFLMKTFPIGRGVNIDSEQPTREQYLKAIEKFKELESKYKLPKMGIQSLLDEIKNKEITVKGEYCISNSLNITNLGFLVLSPWARDYFGNPKKEFIVGDLKNKKLSQLFNSNKYAQLSKKFGE